MKPQATILLVDDDADFVDVNGSVLRAAGYAVVTAASRDEAEAALAGGGIDLLVTDLMMGERNSGFTLAQRVKSSGRAVPIVMITSVTRATGMDFRPRSDDDLRKMNVDAYFDKPVRPQALLDKIAELLG